MFSEISGIVLDIGLGALALSLTRALKANVASMKDILDKVQKTQEDHEARITKLEES